MHQPLQAFRPDWRRWLQEHGAEEQAVAFTVHVRQLGGLVTGHGESFDWVFV